MKDLRMLLVIGRRSGLRAALAFAGARFAEVVNGDPDEDPDRTPTAKRLRAVFGG